MEKWAECEKYYRSRGVSKVVCKGRVRATDSRREVRIKEGLKGVSRLTWMGLKEEDIIRHRKSHEPRQTQKNDHA